MRIQMTQLLNAASMFFPLMAWWKHRKECRHVSLHKIMKWHIPISTTYHLCVAFGLPNPLSSLLFHTDVLMIHITSLSGALSVIRHSLPHQQKQWLAFISSTVPFHINALHRNLYKDQGTYRFALMVINAVPILCCHKKQFMNLFTHASLAFVFLSIDAKHCRLGHSCFHITLYKIYDEYFMIFVK